MGDPLAGVQPEAENALAFVQQARFGLIVDIIIVQVGLIRTFRGLTPKFGCFNDEGFDELEFECHLASNQALMTSGIALERCKPLLCRGLRYSSRCSTEGATAALDIALTIRNRRVSLLWRTFPRGSMGFRIFGPETAPF